MSNTEIIKQIKDGAKNAGRPAWFKMPKTKAVSEAINAGLAHLAGDKDALADLRRCGPSIGNDTVTMYVCDGRVGDEIIKVCRPLAIEVG